MSARAVMMLDVLMRRRNEWVTNCVYCGDIIINVRLCPPEYIVKRLEGKKVLLRIRKRLYRYKIATADHYFERQVGGHSDLNNILPACQTCNNGRSQLKGQNNGRPNERALRQI